MCVRRGADFSTPPFLADEPLPPHPMDHPGSELGLTNKHAWPVQEGSESGSFRLVLADDLRFDRDEA